MRPKISTKEVLTEVLKSKSIRSLPHGGVQVQVVIPIPCVIMITPSRKQFLFYCTRLKICAVRREISHITHSILKYFCIHTITFTDRVHSAFGRHPGN